MAAKKKRVHVVYKGRVQGVGFRYTAEGIAREIGVTGWVRNLPNGDVEAVAEADEKRLGLFLERVAASVVGRHVRKRTINWKEATGEFNDFTVEFVY